MQSVLLGTGALDLELLAGLDVVAPVQLGGKHDLTLGGNPRSHQRKMASHVARRRGARCGGAAAGETVPANSGMTRDQKSYRISDRRRGESWSLPSWPVN